MHTLLLALAIATLPTGLDPAQEPRLPEVPPAVQQRYDKLVEDWNSATDNYNKQATEARAQRKPIPPGPHKEFAGRFVELARAGHPGAASWCLQFNGSTSEAVTERNEIFLACETLLVPLALAAEDPARPAAWWPSIFGVPELLRSIGMASGSIGKTKALALCSEIFDKVATPESKSLALETELGIEGQGMTPGSDLPAEALALMRKLSKEYPTTEAGVRAAGQLFRFENLKVGKTVPDFETRDVEDKPFKISEYRGKVVVLQFWGFWNRNCLKAIPDQRALIERLKDKPFAWIGIDTDTDKEQFRKAAAELGVTWRNSWQGGISGELPRIWGVTSYPTTYVIDAKGVIRYISPRGEALDKAVDTLLAELASAGEKH